MNKLLREVLNTAGVDALIGALDADWTLAVAQQIQQIAAPTFDESRRAAWVAEQFRLLGLADVAMDALHNVYGRLAGAESTRAAMVSAHTDTVFPLETDLTLRWPEGRIYGPGIGDNSLGVAGLLALAQVLTRAAQQSEYTTAVDVWFVANSREEGLGDLGGIRAALDWLGEQVQAAVVLEGTMFGQVCHVGIGVRRYEIKVTCEGGHSWINYGQPSAIHELMHIGSRLTRLRLPKSPRSTLNIGVIEGGRSINSIAPEARLQLDLRSMDAAVLDEMTQRTDQLLEEYRREGVTVTLTEIGNRPFGYIPADHPLVQVAIAALTEVGVSAPQLVSSSTDANIPLSRGVPAVCIGLTTGGNAHRTDEYIDTAALGRGLKQILLTTLGAVHLAAVRG